MKYRALVVLLANLSLLEAILINGKEEEVAEVNPDDLSDVEKNQIKHKFDEVNNLMSKYDGAEKKAKWLNSPEYALQQ